MRQLLSAPVETQIWNLDTKLSLALLIVTILSVTCAFLAYRHQRKRAKKEAACNLAKFYSQKVIDKYSFITQTMRAAGLEAKVKTWFPMERLSLFNTSELEKNLQDKKISLADVDKAMRRIDPFAILNAKMAGCSSVLERDLLWSAHVSRSEDDEEYIIRNSIYLQQDFMGEISNLLNDLEWFSMNCQYRLADEKIIFQSLHQSFLSIIWLLYYYIAKCNTQSPGDKYYTNIIGLFNAWKKRLEKIRKKSATKKQRAKNRLHKVESDEATFVGGKL